MAETQSQLSTTIDFERPGKQCGFLRLPHSVHRSAYGWLPIPLVCVKNGDGPTVLLMAGNHGDEYEGQVALSRLAAALEPEHLRGRVILLPMANYPAAKAGLRTSPIDGGNLNRSFPGDPNGTPTQKIAHYIETVLLDMADNVLDLHSGGSSLIYLPTAIIARSDDAELFAARLALLEAFGAPYGFMFPGGHAGGNSSMHAAARQGVVGLTTEMGGGGMVTPATLRLCEAGVRRVLHHLGVLPDLGDVPASGETTRLLEAPDFSFFVYAPDDGVFEPLVELGATVRMGDPAGLIHTPETPWRAPAAVAFEAAGIVLCKRVPGRTERGDCLFHLGTAAA